MLWSGLLLGLIQLCLIWGSDWPLGIPDEWTWARGGISLFELWNLWPALLAGVSLTLFVALASGRCEQASRREIAGWLMVLWMGGALWSLAALSSIPGIAGLSRVPFVLFYTRSSGYFTQARDDAGDLRQFLATYRERIADSSVPENYLHMGTHPPGLTTAFVGILRLCESSPMLRDALLASRPASVRESFELIRTLTAHDPHPIQPSEEAAIWLAAVLVILMSAGTCVPLFLLARRTVSRRAAWWGAAFWLLVPAVLVFFPKSDVMFPCLAMWIQWFWLEGVDRQSIRFGAAAGLLIFFAVCLSLAFAPIGLILVLQGWLINVRSNAGEATLRPARVMLSRLRVFLGAGSLFVAGIGMAFLWGKINLIDVWLQNLRNHAAFYQHATRSYLSWLIENPMELGFSLGLPLGLLAGAGAVQLGASLLSTESQDSSQNRRTWLWKHLDLIIPLMVWCLLWLSGKNMGEAARLWCFLMPYAVWAATSAIQFLVERETRPRWLIGLFLVQMGVCLGTVLQIDGFHFAALLPQ